MSKVRDIGINKENIKESFKDVVHIRNNLSTKVEKDSSKNVNRLIKTGNKYKIYNKVGDLFIVLRKESKLMM